MLDILGPDGSTLFEIIDRIGAGGMGTVYRVRCVQAGGALAAVKVAHLSPEDGPGFHERFLEEVRNAGPILHRHLVRIRDAGVINSEAAYVLTDFVDGPNLTDYVKQHGPMNARRVAGLGAQILQALQASHDHRYIHRNLTSNNVLLRSSHHATVEVGITDLGLSRCAYPSRDLEAGRHVYVTGGGLRFVDARFAAPECNDLDRWDVPADLFSVGLLIHWMLAAELPFDDETEYRRWLEAEGTIAKSLPIRDDIPDAWRPLLAAALAVRPEERFSSAAQMLAEVHRLRESPGRWETLRSRLGLAKSPPTRLPVAPVPPPPPSILDAPEYASTRLVAETKLQIPDTALDTDPGRVSSPVPDATVAVPANEPADEDAYEPADEPAGRPGWDAETILAPRPPGASFPAAPPPQAPPPPRPESPFSAPTPAPDPDELKLTPVPMDTPIPDAPLRPSPRPVPRVRPWRKIAVGGFVLVMVVAGIWLGRGLLGGREKPPSGPPPAAPPGMVYLPPVKAVLGVPGDEGGLIPEYEERIAGFFLDRTEVSAGAYYDAFRDAPDRWPPSWQGKPPADAARDLPVVDVTLEDARAFAATVGKRLPTADEWERAARSGRGMFPWGDAFDSSVAADPRLRPVTEAGADRTSGGVLDLAGNVSEWTDTPFRRDRRDTVKDRFTIKGGNYRHLTEATARACAQSGQQPSFRDAALGFRCAADATPGGK